nr:choice-of-anchor Q domain-containing protein [Pyrinomonadaceae bacterium]
MTIKLKQQAIFLTVFLFLFLAAANLHAASFTVNNNGDADDAGAGNGVCETAAGNGICTLRAAITESNALAGNDVVNFASGITSISSAAGQMTINSNINITGPGANVLTVQNARAFSATSRVFNITGGTVGISGITISGGNAGGSGGGIFSTGNLTLTGCVVSGNRSSSFGGGIRTDAGILTIIGSTISNNSTSSGSNGAGGIDNGATMNLINSTVSGNSSTVAPGTGGVWSNGITYIVNSTITDNNGAAGGDAAGGLYRFGTNVFTVLNTIVAGNRNNAAVPDIFGTFVSTGNNIIGNRGTATGFANNTNGDKVGETGAGNQIDPMLGTLANNGGRTLTHIPLTGSPAIDAGNNCVFNNTCTPSVGFPLLTDQRGATRQFDGGAFAPQALNTDIGAVEFGALTPTAANVSISGRVLTTEGAGLRNAIVYLTDGNGNTRKAQTGSFGNFMFDGIEAGE